MARCEPHGLELGSCADCRPRAARAPGWPAPRSGPGPYFTAGHPGHCAGCGEDIRPGDEIRADGDGGWERRDCCGMYADEAEEYGSARPARVLRDVQLVEWGPDLIGYAEQAKPGASSFMAGRDESRGC
jgi:hypothetical protein